MLVVRPRLHEQIKPPLIAQILDPYEVTSVEFAQIKYVLFSHVNAALENFCKATYVNAARHSINVK